MRILAIETSTLSCSVALFENSSLIAEHTTCNSRNHSTALLPAIANLIQEHNWTKNSISAVAVGIGTGSFTGLRIGLATAKALCYALDIPLIGVPTMRTLFLQHKGLADYIVPIIDAQQGNVYAAVYGVDGECSEIRVIAKDQLTALIKAPEKYCFCGEIDADIKHCLSAQCVVFPDGQDSLPRARFTALAARYMYARKMYTNINELEPLYIRKSAAEERLECAASCARL